MAPLAKTAVPPRPADIAPRVVMALLLFIETPG
jgi:hypothetical protein